MQRHAGDRISTVHWATEVSGAAESTNDSRDLSWAVRKTVRPLKAKQKRRHPYCKAGEEGRCLGVKWCCRVRGQE